VMASANAAMVGFAIRSMLMRVLLYVDGVIHRPLRKVEGAQPASLETVMRKSSTPSDKFLRNF
jgi:hypothetical protein